MACWEPQARGDRVFQTDLWSWRVCDPGDDDDDGGGGGGDGDSETILSYQPRKRRH